VKSYSTMSLALHIRSSWKNLAFLVLLFKVDYDSDNTRFVEISLRPLAAGRTSEGLFKTSQSVGIAKFTTISGRQRNSGSLVSPD